MTKLLRVANRRLSGHRRRNPHGLNVSPQHPHAKRMECRDHRLRDRRPPTSFSTRSAISAAALLVNVTARIDSGIAPIFSIRCAMRYVMTRVLPLPAPARISTGPSVVSTASRCCGLSCERNVRKTAPEPFGDQNFATSILQEGFVWGGAQRATGFSAGIIGSLTRWLGSPHPLKTTKGAAASHQRLLQKGGPPARKTLQVKARWGGSHGGDSADGEPEPRPIWAITPWISFERTGKLHAGTLSPMKELTQCFAIE